MKNREDYRIITKGGVFRIQCKRKKSLFCPLSWEYPNDPFICAKYETKEDAEKEINRKILELIEDEKDWEVVG